MLEQSRSEGKRTLLDPPESSAFTRHVLSLYWPVRAQSEWGKPVGMASIIEYLRVKGIDEPGEVLGWILLADSEARAWMQEETKREQEKVQRSSQLRAGKGKRRSL